MTKKTIPSPVSIDEFRTKNLRELFEVENCGRCGGTGKYSFNLVDLDRCYGCNGSGWKYTKRGKRQVEAYKSALVKPASEVKVGDRVSPGKSKFFTVISIEILPGHYKTNGETRDGIEIKGDVESYTTWSSDSVSVALPLEVLYQNYLKALGV
jgi:hypothetical protein